MRALDGGLPDASTPQAFLTARTDAAALARGVATICARHGLDREPLRRYPTGSLPVYALGTGWVVKLFPPFDRHAALVEAQALAAVAGRLPVPTPVLCGSGELDGWRYVLMTQLDGQLLSSAWHEVAAADRDRLATELGEMLAALHSVDPSHLDLLQCDWPAFLAQQRASAIERQRALGVDARWLEQLPEFLARWMPAPHGHTALLHTELMREHLLITPAPNRWTLSGLFDFEPAMVGVAEYDLASFGLFVSAGDARFLGRALRAYGRGDAIDDPEFPRRVLAYAILHRYSNLRWYLERLPPGSHCTDLDSLAVHWFTASAN